MAINTAGQTITRYVDQEGSQTASGKIAFDSTTITATDYVRVDLGFKPRYIRWVNLTDRVGVEWMEGFGAAECLKTAATGARTLDTTSAAVVVDKTGFSILQDATLGAIAASKTCYWQAQG